MPLVNSFNVARPLGFARFGGVPTVSGGTLTSDATYYYRTFLANDNLVVSNNWIVMTIEVLSGGMIGGTGNLRRVTINAAVRDYYSVGGGGGSGGRVWVRTSASVGPGTYAVTVGGANGGESSFILVATALSAGSNATTTTGGSGGGSGMSIDDAQTETNGGSGGGGTTPSGGGGGGAGGTASGSSAGSGYTMISGGTVVGAGGSGGPGGYFRGDTVNAYPSYAAAVTPAANTGNGGQGGRVTSSGGTLGAPSNGASGRVVVRYLRSAVGG